MRRYRRRCLPALLLFILIAPAPALATDTGAVSAARGECVSMTPAVQSMPQRRVVIEGQRGLDVRIAARPRHRRAGMQHLCPATVATTAILFLFDGPGRPGFHMRRVHAPLDIAFIGADGRVVSVHRMVVGMRGRVAPDDDVVAALEVAAGRDEALGLEEGVRLELPF